MLTSYPPESASFRSESLYTGDSEDTRLVWQNVDSSKRTALPGFAPWSASTWILGVYPLLLHFISTILISMFVLHYINGHHFNVSSRRPLLPQPDGSSIPMGHKTLLQSDITTILSSALVISRIFSGIWYGALKWRSVFVTLEKPGISLRHMNQIFTYGLPMPSRAGMRGITGVIFIVLVASLPHQAAQPILTGSITWSPSFELIPGMQPVKDIAVSSNGTAWEGFKFWHDWPRKQTQKAVGMASIMWTSAESHQTEVMKRVLPSTHHLSLNSTIANVTIPYFVISSMEWIRDPMSLTQKQRAAYPSMFSASGYAAALIPDSGGEQLPFLPSNRPFPDPVRISESRLLVVQVQHVETRDAGCNSSTFGPLPSKVGTYLIPEDNGGITACYAYANVTYEAGAAICTNCRLSSFTTVENTSALKVQADPMTTEALALMAETALLMSYTNTSLPPAYQNLDEYCRIMLSRSYSAAWSALTEFTGRDTDGLVSPASISVPTSQGVVQSWRVVCWLILNLLLTCCGIVFLTVQRRCTMPMVTDTSIAALLLDSSEVLNRHPDLRGLSTLTKNDSEAVGRLQLSGGRLSFHQRKRVY